MIFCRSCSFEEDEAEEDFVDIEEIERERTGQRYEGSKMERTVLYGMVWYKNMFLNGVS